MSGRTAIIAALPREVAELVRSWRAHREHHHRGIFVWSSADAVVVAAGMGAARAALAFEAALAHGPLGQVVSAGLAGACGPDIAVGGVYEAGEVIDARTGEHFSTYVSGTERRILVTANAVASVGEKRRLFAAYAAAMVDMEAATVARLALAHGIPFRALKAVSDDHRFELSGLDRFTTKHGHFHTRAFALHTAVRPRSWAAAIALGRHSKRALKALNATLREELHPKTTK